MKRTVPSSPQVRSAVTVPRLSWRTSFWSVAFSFFCVTAFSTAPSSLYGLYAKQEGFSSLTITFAYAIYAAGALISLLLVGHVSDWYGRRTVMVPALLVMILAAVVFLVSRSVWSVMIARVLTGLSVGATVATATAYITDLDAKRTGAPTRRADVVSTIANIGGLACGPLIAGLLASRDPSRGLMSPFQVLLVVLVIAVVLLAFTLETHDADAPHPKYRPQRLIVPAGARGQFTAAITGGFLSFGVFGVFAGLAGRFLAGPLHHSSPTLSGFTIFLTFGAGVVMQMLTLNWRTHRLLAIGVPLMLLGLALFVTSAWTSPPSLTLFLAGAVIAGLGGGAVFRGSLSLAIRTSVPEDRAGVLATFFTAGYAGLSIPVIGLGLALEHWSPRSTLLVFATAVGLAIVAATPTLVRRPSEPPQAGADPNT